MRLGPEARFDEILAAEIGVGRCPKGRVLRRDGAASTKVTPAVGHCVVGDPFPQQSQDAKIAMLLVHTSATKLDQLPPDGLVRREIKFLLAIVSTTRCRHAPGLKPVRADYGVRFCFCHQEVIADFVEWVRIQTGPEGGFQAFVQLEIENFKAQRLSGAKVGCRSGQPHLIMGRRAGQQPAGLDMALRRGAHVWVAIRYPSHFGTAENLTAPNANQVTIRQLLAKKSGDILPEFPLFGNAFGGVRLRAAVAENALYKRGLRSNLDLESKPETMRNILTLCAVAALAAVLGTGCAGPEKKLGRGLSNSFEVVRGGEMRRSLEQTAIFERQSSSFATGFIHGLNKTIARTGMGIYEIVTFPIPPYDPVAKHIVKPGRVYPDNYQPRLVDDSLYATDTALGFSGGDVAPIVPGSRFHVFDN